jgi:hypothetical protein
MQDTQEELQKSNVAQSKASLQLEAGPVLQVDPLVADQLSSGR